MQTLLKLANSMCCRLLLIAGSSKFLLFAIVRKNIQNVNKNFFHPPGYRNENVISNYSRIFAYYVHRVNFCIDLSFPEVCVNIGSLFIRQDGWIKIIDDCTFRENIVCVLREIHRRYLDSRSHGNFC